MEVRLIRANKRTNKERLVLSIRSCSAKSPNKMNDQHKRNKPECCRTRRRRASETRCSLDERDLTSCRKTDCSRVFHGNTPFYTTARKHLQQFSCLELISRNCNSMAAATKRRHSTINAILILSHHCAIICSATLCCLRLLYESLEQRVLAYVAHVTVKFFDVTTQWRMIQEENN